MNQYYTEYSQFLDTLFPGVKVQKLSVNAFTTCPNRDGTKGVGGCIYCNNNSFSPEYTRQLSTVREQLEAGRQFFSRKYPEMKYLAYFQSYTSTYGDREKLLHDFAEALAEDDILGLIIGTRPDCIDDELCRSLAKLGDKQIIIEFGAETSNDATLQAINRNHTWEDVTRAVELANRYGFSCGLHIIAGLPGETVDDVVKTVEDCCKLDIQTLKIHQMQVIKGTKLAEMYLAGNADILQFSLDEYIELCCKLVSIIPKRIAIERFVSQSPPGMLIFPQWGIKNYQFTQMLHKQLEKKNIH